MSRLPWFKAYPADFLTDQRVDEMPPEAEGLLWRMWCLTHLLGYCPADPATLARKILRSLEYVTTYLKFCLPLFEEREGRLYSRRMEEERRRSEINRQNANERYKKTKSNTKSESVSEGESERPRANRSNANGSAIRSANPLSSRIPSNFKPNENHKKLAEAMRVDIESAFPAFVDHYKKTGNAFEDWDAAFSSWLRKEPNFSRPSKTHSFATIADHNERVLEEYERKKSAAGGM